MSATILDGKAIAAQIRGELAVQVSTMTRQPSLHVVLVGNDPASEVYVKNKIRACEEVGIESVNHRLDDDITEAELITLIDHLNNDDKVDGILVQLPLPVHINADNIIEDIDPKKDVDGFHPFNIGRLAAKKPCFKPCTPAGVMKLLERTGTPLRGQHAVVVGASTIVGRPLALEFLLNDCTVTVCHEYTKDLGEQVRQADILAVAIGKVGVIQTDWIKPSTIVIDIGINRLADGSLCGDVDFATAKEVASWITPVPGGVGPMTVAMLCANTVQAFQQK